MVVFLSQASEGKIGGKNTGGGGGFMDNNLILICTRRFGWPGKVLPFPSPLRLFFPAFTFCSLLVPRYKNFLRPRNPDPTPGRPQKTAKSSRAQTGPTGAHKVTLQASKSGRRQISFFAAAMRPTRLPRELGPLACSN